MAKGILAGFKVVEMAHPLTEYAGCVLAGLGADVYLVEPPSGSPLRERRPLMEGGEASSRRSLPFLTRNTNKRSVVVDAQSPDDVRLLTDMVERADLVLDADTSHCHGVVGEAKTQNRVVLTDRLGLGTSSVVAFAASGGLASSGWPEQPPCNAPGWLALDGASIYAACVGLIGAIARRRGSGPVTYEIPLEEAAVAAVTPWTRPLHAYGMVAAGQGASTRRLGSGGYPIYPAADGYVRAVAATQKQWDAFVALLGNPDDLVNGPWADVSFRTENNDALQLLCSELTRKLSVDELFHRGQALGLTVTPLSRLDEFRNDRHVEARGLFVTVDDPEFGPLEMMRPPVLFDDKNLNVTVHPAPALGEHQEAAREMAAGPVPHLNQTSDADGANALRGVRVLELGVGAVVPEAAALLAAFGADVCKIESRVHPDFLRRVGINGHGDVDGCPTFNQLNLGVASLAVDMSTAEGAALVRELARRSDIIMENMRGGVVEKWGLDYAGARELNGDVLYFSSQGLGRGVYDSYQTFGPNLQTFSGVTWQWSHPDDPFPVGTTLNHPDHMAGKQGLVPLLAGLLRRFDGGAGQHIEAAQVEAAAYLMQAKYLEASIAGHDVTPLGNISPDHAPHGCYPCRGEDRWIAIAVETADQWRALHAVLVADGTGELPDAANLRDVNARLERREEIDGWLAAYTRERDGRALQDALREHGIPVSLVMTGDDIADDQDRHASQFYAELDHPHVGVRTYTGLPILLDGKRRIAVSRSPLLGEHTEAVLSEVLGVTDSDFADLLRRKIVGH